MEAFERWVRDWLQGQIAQDWAIKASVGAYKRLNKSDRKDAEDCAKFAVALSINDTEDALDLFKELSPSIYLDSERLGEMMRPEIEGLRKNLFGRSDIPFKTLAKSVEWIEHTQAEYHGRATCEEFLAYAVPDNRWVHRAPAFRGSPLEPLDQLTRRMASETGLHQAAVVAYALVGIPPILPLARIKVDRRLGGTYPRTSATIQIFSGDLTFAQFRRLYDRVRQRMGTTKQKALSDRDVRLLQLGRKLGEPPMKQPGNRGAIGLYWRDFVKEWNRTSRTGKLTQRAAQNRYERLQNKLQRHPPHDTFLGS